MDYLDHLDLPDGQSADLLTRLTWDRAAAIELATERDEVVTDAVLAEMGTRRPKRRGPLWSGWADAVMRAHLWRASLKHGLTGEAIDADGIGSADPTIVGKIRTRAIELYMAWLKEVTPAPKGSASTTGAPTPSTEAPASETNEPA